MVFSTYIFSFWGLGPQSPQTPTRALPLNPAGGLLSPVPRFCPPLKQISGYAPATLPCASDLKLQPLKLINA